MAQLSRWEHFAIWATLLFAPAKISNGPTSMAKGYHPLKIEIWIEDFTERRKNFAIFIILRIGLHFFMNYIVIVALSCGIGNQQKYQFVYFILQNAAKSTTNSRQNCQLGGTLISPSFLVYLKTIALATNSSSFSLDQACFSSTTRQIREHILWSKPWNVPARQLLRRHRDVRMARRGVLEVTSRSISLAVYSHPPISL